MIKPILDRIIVKVLEEKEAKGGLWLPEDAKSTLVYGKVLAVGPGRRVPSGEFIPTTLKVGDTVIFRPNPTDFAIVDGKEILTMYEAEVIGTV